MTCPRFYKELVKNGVGNDKHPGSPHSTHIPMF